MTRKALIPTLHVWKIWKPQCALLRSSGFCRHILIIGGLSQHPWMKCEWNWNLFWNTQGLSNAGGERKASMKSENASPSSVVGPVREVELNRKETGAASSFSFSYQFVCCMIHFPIAACSVCAYAWICFAALLQIDSMPIDRCICKVFFLLGNKQSRVHFFFVVVTLPLFHARKHGTL